MFDHGRSVIAFQKFLRSLKGKRISRMLFEAYLPDGQRAVSRSEDVQEEKNNVIPMRKKRKKGA